MAVTGYTDDVKAMIARQANMPSATEQVKALNTEVNGVQPAPQVQPQQPIQQPIIMQQPPQPTVDVSKLLGQLGSASSAQYNNFMAQQQARDAQYAQQRQQQIAGMDGKLKANSDLYYSNQKAQLEATLAQQTTDLKKAYDDAVANGEISVREAEKQFNEQKAVIEQQAYKDSQVTNLYGNAMGIQNSQQQLGRMASDNARNTGLINKNITVRDQRINDIRDRLNALTKQKDLDLANANTQYNLGLQQARGQADLQYGNGMFDLQKQNYFADLDQQYQQQNMATQQGYNMQNQASQNMFDLTKMGAQQGMDIDKMNLGQYYNQMNAQQQQAYTQQNMATQQNYDLSKLNQQQKYTLEQMAKAQGYDLEKMNQQQINQLAQMAKAQGYDLEKMQTQQNYTQENMQTEFNNSIKQLGEQSRLRINEMNIQQGLDLQKMSKSLENDIALMTKKFGYDSALQSQSAKAEMEAIKKRGEIEMQSEEKAYQVARDRELAKYTPGTPEYKVRASQLEEAYKQNIANIHTQTVYEATAKAVLENPALNSKVTTKPQDVSKNWGALGNLLTGYKSDLKEYNAYQDALKRKNEFLNNPAKYIGGNGYENGYNLSDIFADK